MLLIVLFITTLFQRTKAFPRRQHDPEIKMAVPEIIRYHGYPVEVHHVVTQDGYILELHRIPYGRKGPSSNISRPVVFLQHGLECSSSNWVTNLPEQGAGFVFSDAGFDVWLGNMRGNDYSKRHIKLNPFFSKFWDFTWDEMAMYDLPAMVDHVLLVTKQPHLYYVGHSQGTLTMFAKLSEDPSFAEKIRMFFALAPVGSVAHIRGLLKYLADFLAPEFSIMVKIFGSRDFLQSDWLMALIKAQTCGSIFAQKEICNNLMFAIAGPDTSGLNSSRIPVYVSHTPSGTSSLNVMHWIQMVRSDTVAKFDYGEKRNMKKYGQPIPPVYNFSNIPKIDIHLYTGGNDWLANTVDIYGYLMPRIKEAVKLHTELPEYNHLDFIWGNRAASDIYRPVAEFIRKHSKVV